MARRANQEVLQIAGTTRELINAGERRQLGFLGHALRRNGREGICLLGMIEEKRTRGRQILKCMDGIKVVNGFEKIDEVVRISKDEKLILGHSKVRLFSDTD